VALLDRRGGRDESRPYDGLQSILLNANIIAGEIYVWQHSQGVMQMMEHTTTETTTDVHIERITFPDTKNEQLDSQPMDDERAVLEAMLGREEQDRLQQMFPRDKPGLRAYGASLAGGFAIVPIIMLVFTVAAYLILSVSGTPNWAAVAAGFVATSIAWLLISWPLSGLTARDKVNTRSYGMLVNRLSQLETRLQVIQATRKKFSQFQLIALEEAYVNFQELDAMLYESTARLPWVLGLGYVVAWFKLHRAEEALMEIEPIEMVVREAYHDHLALSNSKLNNANEMLDRLHDAVKILDPGMADVVCSSSPMADIADSLRGIADEIQEVEGQVKQVSQQLAKQDTSPAGQPARHAQESSSGYPSDESNARVTIREIRRTLNEYRDIQWDNLIRGRNRLMGGIFITGFTTYVLLCIALLAVPSASDVARLAILAATAYYVIGAIAGLFSTIYRESTGNTNTNTDADDYGLTLARLIGTPLLSGLAGIAGAMLYNTIVIQVAQATTPNPQQSLSSIFNLNRLDYLLAAALAGYAPSIIVQSLQQRANKNLSALQSSKASDASNN
jgi:hypothetical protein